ncbi:hypothetical protein IJ541_02595 [bacterium]|nr:hypothetical protein [bacterium]
MFEGVYVDNIMMHSETRVYPTEPQITAGLIVGSQAIYRYGLRESSYPTLTLVEELKDINGNVIPAGHYELALSDEKDFLILVEAKKAIALIPVFKVEIDMSRYEQVRDNKSLKRQKKEQKEIAKTNKKRAKQGMPPVNEEQDIYQEATIEYVPAGSYYLIRYERGDVKAWGAIKY